MADFTHTYREEQIPGASQSGVITAHTPGRLIAKAVTELQERVVVDVNVEGTGVEDAGSDVTDNTLNLRLRVEFPEIPEVEIPDPLPEGGEPNMVLVRTVSSSNEFGVAWDYVRAVEVTQ
jgi:hypothetical protein